MQSLTAAVLGATGLTGEQLVQQLLNDSSFSKVRILVRRRLEISHPKLEVEIVDFDNVREYRQKLGKGDCIFCCIGTTQKQVKGDKAAYRKVDFDIPVHAAEMGKDAGFSKYLFVSSVGANLHSKNFYLHLKGEVENEIAKFNYNCVHIFRPSILLGQRKKSRIGESIGKVAAKAFSIFLTGTLKKYKGIDSAAVAKAMAAAAKSDSKGIFIHHYDDIMKLASA